MRKTFLFGMLCFSALCAGAVERGDSRDSVLAELGTPQGNMVQGDREILLYPKGTVTLENGKVTESDISNRNLERAEERRERAAQIREEKQAQIQQQQKLHPEEKLSLVACKYEKNENWSYLPESIRPTESDCGYLIYLPPDYYESETRYYPCLFIERSAQWQGVRERVFKEKWVAVVLSEQQGANLGRKMNESFLAAYDDALNRFRISRRKLFLIGNIPSLLYATMRPVAGVILLEPNFDGLKMIDPPLDLLRKNSDMRVYGFFSAQDKSNFKKQAHYLTTHIPKYHLYGYEEQFDILPPYLVDISIDWMKQEYRLH